MNLDDASGDNLTLSDHYLKVYWGWGAGYNDVYIPYDLVSNGYWTLSRIDQISEINTGVQTSLEHTQPAFVDLGDRVIMGLRTSPDELSFYRTVDGRNFDLAFKIPAPGHNAPSLALEPSHKYLYVAWSQEDESLALAKVDLPPGHEGSFTMLKAPQDPNIGMPYPGEGLASPAITIHKGKLYYVWGGNIAYTPLDWLERYGRPWPSELDQTLTISGEKSCWVIWDMTGSVGSPGSIDEPSLVSDGCYLYVGSNRHSVGHKVTVLDDNGSIVIGSSGSPLEAPSGQHLCYFRNRLYSSTDGPICEIYIAQSCIGGGMGRMGPGGTGGQPVQLVPNRLDSKEILWPYDINAQYVVLGSAQRFDLTNGLGNGNLGPCLFSSWIDDSGTVKIRYHSIESLESRGNPLDYSGWIL
jgi:hypothetical protein